MQQNLTFTGKTEIHTYYTWELERTSKAPVLIHLQSAFNDHACDTDLASLQGTVILSTEIDTGYTM